MFRTSVVGLTAVIVVLLSSASHGEEKPAGSTDVGGFILTVDVGGKSYEMKDGVAGTIRVGDVDVPLTVRVLPERQFDADGIRFRFPSDMAVQRTVEDGVTTWSLDGQDVVLMLVLSAEPHEAGNTQTTVQGIRQALAGTATGLREQASTLRLGGKDVAARRLSYQIAGERVFQVVTSLPVANGSVILMLQESGESTPEADRVRSLLDRTFQVVR
jgi:hypothetical protein